MGGKRTAMVVTVREAKDHVGIDFNDKATDRILRSMIVTADTYLSGALGKDYPRKDSRSKTLALMIVSDLFDNRGMVNVRVTATIRKLVDDFSLQLKLGMREKDGGV
jgi:hypothetical protein